MTSWINIFGMILSLILIMHTKRGTNANPEVDALMAVKAALIDPKNVLQNWDPTLADPCTWFHITCNVDSKVTRIDLGNYGLSGHLAPEVTRLTYLQYLELFHNSVGGSIPNEIGNLANLINLELYNNKFTGPLPKSIGNLSKLKFLRVNSNDLSGCIPIHDWRNIIPNLVQVDVSNNPRLCTRYTNPPCYC